jgi:hypothetical protein
MSIVFSRLHEILIPALLRLEMRWLVTSGEWLVKLGGGTNGQREIGKGKSENEMREHRELWRLIGGAVLCFLQLPGGSINSVWRLISALVWVAGAGGSEQKSDELARKGKVRNPGLP